MKKINNKGFTLVEILAVVVIIGLLGVITVPRVMTALNTGTETSYNVLVSDIVTAGKQLYEEIEFNKSELYRYYVPSGKSNTDKVVISSNRITVNLQTLVSNGFLTGLNNKNNSGNVNKKIILNPKTKSDIGACQIIIIKNLDSNYKVTYTFEGSTEEGCPTTDELNSVTK